MYKLTKQCKEINKIIKEDVIYCNSGDDHLHSSHNDDEHDHDDEDDEEDSTECTDSAEQNDEVQQKYLNNIFNHKIPQKQQLQSNEFATLDDIDVDSSNSKPSSTLWNIDNYYFNILFVSNFVRWRHRLQYYTNSAMNNKNYFYHNIKDLYTNTTNLNTTSKKTNADKTLNNRLLSKEMYSDIKPTTNFLIDNDGATNEQILNATNRENSIINDKIIDKNNKNDFYYESNSNNSNDINDDENLCFNKNSTTSNSLVQRSFKYLANIKITFKNIFVYLIKLYLNSYLTMLIFHALCFLIFAVDNTDARPNVDNLLTNEGDSLHISSSDNPASNLMTPSSEGELIHKVADGGHHVERFPIAKVEFDRVKTPFIIGLWILSSSVAKIGFHMTPRLHRMFPESCLLIVVGVVIGIVINLGTQVNVSPLTPNTFFFYMLPPIILDAGYFMPNRLFFDNLGTILLMAVVGTIFNITTIGGSLWACGLTGLFNVNLPLLDVFLFASLISAVDPVAVLAVFEEIHVNEILYIVVFGESLLNDAVTVVVYHMMEVYKTLGDNLIAVDLVSGVGSFFVVAVGGTLIGVMWGFLTGLVTRFTDHVRVIEPIFIFVMAYLAYLNAEIFHMSGILAITFCGITMKNYVESNISQKSHTTVKYALKMLSSSAETIIFMFLGVATVNNTHNWNTAFVLLTILFCSVFRVIGVIILTAIANRFRLHKLSKVDQFVISYGGLRGAVAFALVLLIPEDLVKEKNMFVTTTIAVIYFTVFLQGITIKPLVKFLNVKRASKRKPTMNERIHERFMDHLMAGVEDIVGKTGNFNARDKFKRFDNRFIRPFLLRDAKGAEPKILETYSKLTMKDAMEVMRRNPSTIGQISGTESMGALFRTYTNNCLGISPSFSNLDTSTRNLDMQELHYNPSKKDLTDAKIHHLLAEELKPYRRHRRLSYSRHAVDDRDLSTQVNYRMHMNIRRMVNDRKHHKRSKKGKDGVKQNHVSFHEFRQNGSEKQLTNDYINDSTEDNPIQASNRDGQSNEDWDDGLTFTAKATLEENGTIVEEDLHALRDSENECRVQTPTAIESQLPWKRNESETDDNAPVKQNEFPAWASNKEYLAYNSPSATFLGGLSKPKQAKSVIGLFRRDSSMSGSGHVAGALSSAGNSIDPIENEQIMIVTQQLQQAQQHGTPSSQTSERHSISGGSNSGGDHKKRISVDFSEGHAGPFPVTASHRRNTRRGSMLEISGFSIPEETTTTAATHQPIKPQHHHTKSLCEPSEDEWENSMDTARNSSKSEKFLRFATAKEPLLPKFNTLKPQIKPRSMVRNNSTGVNPAAARLLPGNNNERISNTSDDDDDESENDNGIRISIGDSIYRNKTGSRNHKLNSTFDDDDDDDDDDNDENLDVYSDDHIYNSNFLDRDKKDPKHH